MNKEIAQMAIDSLINIAHGKVVICCGATQSAINMGCDAGKVASIIAKNFGGGGGGSSDFAQGGFKKEEK